MMDDTASAEALIEIAASIVTAYVKNNAVPEKALPDLISSTFASLARLQTPVAEPVAPPVPAVPVKKSIFRTHLVCLDCGRQFASLARHLGSTHGMRPSEYRAKWDLAPSYPMVSPDYSVKRRNLAKASGLGTRATSDLRLKNKKR